MREVVGHDWQKDPARNTYIHEIGQMRMQCGNRRVCASISDMHALFSIESTTRHDPSSLPSFLVMLTMRPTWRRAYTNFRHFSLLHRKWTLRVALINIDCAKEFGISSANVCMHMYIYGIASIEVEVSFLRCVYCDLLRHAIFQFSWNFFYER